jgi:hypothetical protein
LKHSSAAQLLALLLLVATALPSMTRAAGVTIITHGLNSNVDDWVISMADRITKYPLFPGSNSTCYELYFIPAAGGDYTMTWRRLAGVAPTLSDSGEILIKLDWRQLANDQFDTRDVAARTVGHLLETNFISELGGHALAESPFHLIGHSRGGSLVCELSRELGTNGLWIDHLTTLDPHPLNNDGFDDKPFYSNVDAPCRTYENILFHDNYFQELNLIAFGESVDGAFVRELLNLDGGYGGFTASHSDVHLWYHGTLDLRNAASDTVANVSGAERAAWWTSAEETGASAGFHYSLIGKGDRLSSFQPAGAGMSRIRDGYNQRWNLGAGQNDNRVPLPRNNGRWPNLIRLNLAGTNQMVQGESNAVTLYYQLAQPNTSEAIVSVYLDDDFNPYNGNEQLVREGAMPGTGASSIGSAMVPINIAITNSTPGWHSIYARITAGGRTRYLYAPEMLNVLPAIPPPPLAPGITGQPNSQIIVAGATTTFPVVATGTPPLSFQWRKDDMELQNATNSVLQLNNLTSNDAGGYTVVITNEGGSITSAVAILTLAYPPTVIVQPISGIILFGEPFTLPIEVTGTEPFAYQWFLNGRRLIGQTNAQLSVPKVAAKNKGEYQVEVSNSFGAMRTNVFIATVVRPPKILRSPGSLTVDPEQRATFRVVASGSRPLLFQWLKDGTAIENATNRVFTILSAQSTDAGNYFVRVSNIGAVRESSAATLTVSP